MLRKIRITFAIFSIIVVSLLFLDFTGIAQQWWGWMAKIQFVPAFLSLNVVVILLLLLATYILGRAYCSIVCPLGILQDIVARIRYIFTKKTKRRNRYNYTKPKTLLRLVIMLFFIVLIILGLCNIIGTTFVSFVEPYSSYGRIASSLFVPVYDAGNNVIANTISQTDCYWFYNVERANYLPLTIVALITLFIVGGMAWIGGRAYCNTICPVGTILGLISKYSLLKPIIDKSKCNGCTKCARNCKASCIDAKNHKIDYSRCVVCMDCINNCSTGAIEYRMIKKNKSVKVESDGVDKNRRSFMTMSAILLTTTAVKATDKTTDGGLAKIIMKEKPSRKKRITPPGAISMSHLQQHCTGCQLCVSVCPNNVLQPSLKIDTFMQPVVEFNDGYCRPECVKCSEVCPAGVFHEISVAEKSSLQIGRATVKYEDCITAAKGKRCGNCADKCPTGAIKMVPRNPNDDKSNYMPVVNESKCIGCGACEYYCPVRPLSAICVEGNDVHRNI